MDISDEHHRGSRRAPAARWVPALPKRRVAVLRGRVQHKRRVHPLRRALARRRRPRTEEEQGHEGGVRLLCIRLLFCYIFAFERRARVLGTGIGARVCFTGDEPAQAGRFAIVLPMFR